jgi:hypothetical protein
MLLLPETNALILCPVLLVPSLWEGKERVKMGYENP